MTVGSHGSAPVLPPAVVVHGLDMARHAVRAAASLGRGVTLLSAPGAGAYAGVGWWRALVAAAVPDGGVPDVLDCGPAPGRALEALRAGQRLLVLRVRRAVWEDVAGRAAACGGALLAEPPPSIDMAERDAPRRLEAWLAGCRDRPPPIG